MVSATLRCYAVGPDSGAFLSTRSEQPLPSISVWKTKKKKNKYDVNVTIDTPRNPRRGERGVLVRATISQPGLICRLTVKYLNNDAEDSPDNVTSDAGGVCTFHFDLPNKSAVVGDGQLIVTAQESGGRTRGEAKLNIDIYD